MDSTPAHCLEGIELENGWRVIDKISRKLGSTGGKFSVGYRVEDKKDGKFAFLKALDFSAASQVADPARALQQMLEAYNFERDVLLKCRNKRLGRVMTPLLDGSVNIPGFGIYSPVYYLIFELASGDIRDILFEFDNLDLAWCLRSLHHATVGLQQLHSIGIAHQDLKPSNMLVLEKNNQKIGDLGRASDQNIQSQNDFFPVPGDGSYASPDLWYQGTGVDGFEKRFLADAYLLESLFFFHFSGVSAAHALRSKLHGAKLGNNNFKEDLPYFQHAFEETIEDLKSKVEDTAGELSIEIMQMVRQLCEPDPNLRGDPKWRGSLVPKYDLQRYISGLDRLCRKAEMKFR